jgi:hypothetical protein
MVQQSIICVVIHGLVLEKLSKGQEGRTWYRREKGEQSAGGRTAKIGHLKKDQGTEFPDELQDHSQIGQPIALQKISSYGMVLY